MAKKTKSKFSRMQQIVVWVMLISLVGTAFLSLVMALSSYFK